MRWFLWLHGFSTGGQFTKGEYRVSEMALLL